ncbi:hypothetical protein [Labilibacter marinus]|uniref:hypothetical protein n=1 Tax=Labilibacter marinus TaxID=1477105 RepID=UPI00082DBC8B|nr:hypothetical protein [Labilibacter marinus]
MTDKKYVIKLFAVSTIYGVVLSFVGGFMILWSSKENIENFLLIITLIIGLIIFNKVRKQDELFEFISNLFISIIYTLRIAIFYEGLHPQSEEGVKTLSSFIILFWDHYFLFMAGIILSICNLIRRKLKSS